MSLCDSCSLFPCTDDGTKIKRRCSAYNPKQKPQTNADSVRAMTDEELASLLYPVCVHGLVIEHGECDKEDKSFCVDCWLDWLKKEVE